MRPAASASTRSRNRSFASRSGEMSRMSTAPAPTACSTRSHSSWLSELMVSARTPIRSAAATWLRISASRGLTRRVGPSPASRSSRVVMK